MGDGIIALFPYEPGDSAGTCKSFEHIGQHGAAHLINVISASRPASPGQYAALRRELESPPYEYRLRVVSRTPKDDAEIRRLVLARDSGKGIQVHDAAGTERMLRAAGLCNHQTGYGLPWMTYCGEELPCREHLVTATAGARAGQSGNIIAGQNRDCLLLVAWENGARSRYYPDALDLENVTG